MNKRNFKFIIVLSLLFAASAVMAGGGKAKKKKKQKPLKDSNPIILSHGMIGFSDDQLDAPVNIIKAWGGMDDYLRKQGAKVFVPQKTALHSSERRAGEQREQILLWMAANGYDEANIFGHSQGAQDSRYMISNLGMADDIAVFTSINGVNKGAPLADIVSQVIPDWLQGFIDLVGKPLMGWLYDESDQDLWSGLDSLKVSNADAFNANNPDMSGVSYQSYGSFMTLPDPIQHPITALLHPATAAGGLHYGLGIKNDGLVNLKSQKYGQYNGEPKYKFWVTGVDHFQVVNVAYLGEIWFDVEKHFLKMAKNAMRKQ